MDESAVCSAEVGFANQMRATHTVPSCVLAPHESHYESTLNVLMCAHERGVCSDSVHVRGSCCGAAQHLH
jgi:hypothetical protein